MGGFSTPQKKKKEQRITVRKSTKHRHHNSYFSAMIHSSTLKTIPLYLNTFLQNKHITTLLTTHVSILLMHVNQFICSCEETLRKLGSGRRKKTGASRDGLYSRSLSSFTCTSLTFLGV